MIITNNTEAELTRQTIKMARCRVKAKECGEIPLFIMWGKCCFVVGRSKATHLPLLIHPLVSIYQPALGIFS